MALGVRHGQASNPSSCDRRQTEAGHAQDGGEEDRPHVLSIAAVWEGDIVLPPLAPSARYRLVVVEYEEYLADDSRPYDPVPTKKDRRIVFVEHVPIG